MKEQPEAKPMRTPADVQHARVVACAIRYKPPREYGARAQDRAVPNGRRGAGNSCPTPTGGLQGERECERIAAPAVRTRHRRQEKPSEARGQKLTIATGSRTTMMAGARRGIGLAAALVVEVGGSPRAA